MKEGKTMLLPNGIIPMQHHDGAVPLSKGFTFDRQ